MQALPGIISDIGTFLDAVPKLSKQREPFLAASSEQATLDVRAELLCADKVSQMWD